MKILAFLLIFTLLRVHAMECDDRLAPDLYYGIVEKGLAMGPLVLTDRHLDKILASLEPIDPLEKETPTVENGHIKEILEHLVKDAGVRAKWPETIKKLALLKQKRSGDSAISVDAAEATRRVLAPHEHFKFSSEIDFGVAPVTLPNGVHALAHFKEKYKIILNELLTRDEIATVNLPREFNPNGNTSLNWYTDAHGKLWLYIADKTQIFRMPWGVETHFQPVRLDILNGSTSILGMHSPMPGAQIIQVQKGFGGTPQFYDIASGRAEPKMWGESFEPGQFLVLGDKIIPPEPPLGRWALSRIYDSSQGKVLLAAEGNTITGTIGGKPLVLTKPDDWINLDFQLSFFEFAPGHALVAASYVNDNAKQTRAIAIWDLQKPGAPISIINTGEQPREVHWFKDPQGTPLLAYTFTSMSLFNQLQIVDPFTKEELNYDLHGQLKGWFELDGESYAWIANRAEKTIFRMLFDRKAP